MADGEGWTVNSDVSFNNFVKHVRGLYDKHKFVMFSWKTGRQRTDTQNAAIHVFCREIAEALNDAGFEMEVKSDVLKSPVEVPWTMESVKELIWRPVQMANYPDKKSTTKLERTEVSEVAEVITRYLAEKKGVVAHFPSREKGETNG